MTNDGYINIGETAELMDISIDTLRRWDESGKFKATRTAGGHRVYRKHDVEIFLSDLFKIASEWVSTPEPSGLPNKLYCLTSSVFQTRLQKMQTSLGLDASVVNYFSLLVAMAGEIGSNSFDHNLGNWPDMQGILFAFDIHKKQIILADRGLGILQTLKRVRPELPTHAEALRVAFTEIISGRSPEARGNGLKFVRKIIQNYPINLIFQTGNASLILKHTENELKIEDNLKPIRGCLALITY